jgi:hypothetical protein
MITRIWGSLDPKIPGCSQGRQDGVLIGANKYGLINEFVLGPTQPSEVLRQTPARPSDARGSPPALRRAVHRDFFRLTGCLVPQTDGGQLFALPISRVGPVRMRQQCGAHRLNKTSGTRCVTRRDSLIKRFQ